MNIGDLVNLLPGHRYIFRYRLSNQRVDREGVAVYLDRTVRNDGTINLVLSGRPEFGTTELNSDSIISVQPSTYDKCYMDRKVV